MVRSCRSLELLREQRPRLVEVLGAERADDAQAALGNAEDALLRLAVSNE